MKVFLGGTCNDSKWRDKLIQHLEVDYFNPVVEDWTPECMSEELHQRNTCDKVLYTITPKMTGVYSIAELVEDSIKRPEKTIMCTLEVDDGDMFTNHQLKSIIAVENMVKRNGGIVFNTLYDLSVYLNNSKE